MAELNVTEAIGDADVWGAGRKRLTVEHVENGWIVKYTGEYDFTVEYRAVFTNPTQMIEFVTAYFGGKEAL